MPLQGIEFGDKPVTVWDLIENLRSLDPDALVVYNNFESFEFVNAIECGYSNPERGDDYSAEQKEGLVPAILIT